MLFYSTGDPTYNTTAPVGSLANTPWQYEGNWRSFLGTAIAPQYFITAYHVGGNAGEVFNLNGVNYTTIPFPDGSAYQRITATIGGDTYNTDLVIWRIAGTFPTFAPLYNSSLGADGPETNATSANNPAVVIGRGTQRGAAVSLNGDPRGWEWGPQDGVRRWGTNVISGAVTLNDSQSTGYALKINFDANPADRSGASATGYSGVNEATLTNGDSGGGLFIKTASGAWKLAGVNWAVATGYSTTQNTTGPNASLYDTGGYYLGSNLIADTAADVPVSAYVSQISQSRTAINGVTGNSYAWNVDASGYWTTSGNWWFATNTTTTPNGTGKEVVFGSIITAPRTVTLTTNRTVGNLVFDGPNAYTLDGTGVLTLDSTTPADPNSTVSVTVYRGNHTITAPLTLNKGATLQAYQANSSLTIAGTFTPAEGTTLTKTGPGTFAFPNLRVTNPLVINAGTIQITANGTAAGTSKLNSLTVNGGRLDLVDNDLVLDYTGATPYETVRQYLLGGLNSGAWNGTGIVSSAAAGDAQHRTAIAIAEASTLLGLSGAATTTWSGQTVDVTSLLLEYTWFGDANFDGRVDAGDYALLDRGMALGLTGWVNGDFNYDGLITAADFALIDRAYMLQSGTLSPEMLASREAQFGAEYVSELLVSLPEPSAGACVAAAILPFLGRGRRRGSSGR